MPLPSNDWQWHLKHVRAVLRSLRVAGLTANPQKYAIGRVEVRYLGFHLGDRQVRPEIDKTAAKAAYPGTKNKKEVRPFEGLAEYYSRCIPNYSELTSPLTDLTKKEAPDPVQWTELYVPTGSEQVKGCPVPARSPVKGRAILKHRKLGWETVYGREPHGKLC